MNRVHPIMLAVMALSIVAVHNVVAQGGEDYFQLKLKGRSEEVRKLLGHQPDRGERNILFLVNPMTCPRCEGLMLDLMRGVGRRASGGARLCVINYPRLSGAMAYASERRFPVNTVIDTSGALFAELGAEQSPPFISVWDSTGHLLFAQAIYGISNDDSVLWRNILHARIADSPTAPAETPSRSLSLDVGYDEGMVTWRAPAGAP